MNLRRVWLGMLVLVSMTGIALISFGLLELFQAGASSPQAAITGSDTRAADGQTPVPEGEGPTSVPVSVPTSTLPRPPGESIVFASERDTSFEIYVMNSDGSDLTRLTNSPDRDIYPEWSPDANRTAYASHRDGNFEIYIVGASNSD